MEGKLNQCSEWRETSLKSIFYRAEERKQTNRLKDALLGASVRATQTIQRKTFSF